MQYISTRGAMTPTGFTDILLEGLAPDGGLCVPEHYPRLDDAELTAMRPLGYPGLAFAIISRFAPDLASADLRGIIDRTYTAVVFGSDAITPLETLDDGSGNDLHLLRLSNGPTLAFKDIAMQLLGNLFEHVLSAAGRELNILGATSGDTGSAAEAAMAAKHNIRVFMLSPHGKMSPFQAAQMYTHTEANIVNLAVHGVFDDCQDLVKAISGDVEFKTRHQLGAVNSINWGRIVAQVVYYFRGYFAATCSNDEQVSFAVPSGNFGNILAGHVARCMGLPIDALVLATNENDVLDEFFRTGRYRVRRAEDVHATSSPSMDISKASNFERFVFDATGRDADRTRRLFDDLSATGGFDLDRAEIEPFGFRSGRSSHAERVATIRSVYRASGRVIDPHTADGIRVASDLRLRSPVICLETALPAKFSATIEEALGMVPDRPPAFVGIEAKPHKVIEIDADADAVKRVIREATGH